MDEQILYNDSNNNNKASSIFIQFKNQEGQVKGNPIYIPLEANNDALHSTLKSLIEEILNDLKSALEQHRIKYSKEDQENFESTVEITYQLLSRFKVQPVSRCSATIPGHKSAILITQFSPDGSMLATGSADATVRLWDLNTQLPSTLCADIHMAPVMCLAWSPDGENLASGCQGGVTCIWSIVKPEDMNREDVIKKSLNIGEMFLRHKMIKPNASAQTMKNRCMRSFCWRPLHLDQECRYLASSHQDGTITVWDCMTGSYDQTLAVHENTVTCLKWSGSDFLLSASQDRTIKIWRFSPSKTTLEQSLQIHGHWINCLALSTDYVIRTGYFDPAFLVKQTQIKRINTKSERQINAQALYTSVKGKETERLVACSDDNTLSLWKLEANEKETITCRAIEERMTGHMGVVNDVKFSPNGRFIASASFDHSVKIWCGIRGTFLATFFGHVQEVYLVVWSSDSRLVVSCSRDSTVKVWSTNECRKWSQQMLTGGQQAEIAKNNKFKRLPTLDPFITADNVVHDKKKKINSRGFFQGKRHILSDLPGHEDAVYALDWSPDGQFVASGGKDKVLKLWKA